MPVPPPDLHRGWTLVDLDTLTDDGQRYEVVDGGLVVTPPPTQRHQMLGYDLHDQLRAAAPDGWRVRLGVPLPFAEDTQRRPDVVAHRWPLQHPRADERNPLGGPTASPSRGSTPRRGSACFGGWKPSLIWSCTPSSWAVQATSRSRRCVNRGACRSRGARWSST